MIAKIIELSARNKFFVFLMIFFAIAWGYWALRHTPVDAIPDLSDTQVIVYTEWSGRSPDLVEDQITYPITSTLLAAPKVQAVRGFSYFGSSFIYIIFEEGTDIYWARSRVLEYLQSVRNKLPASVNPVLGPDASSVGLGFSYALVDEKGPSTSHSSGRFRTGPQARHRERAGGLPGGEHRRLCKTVPDHRRPQSPRGLQHTDHQGDGGGAAEQPRRGRPGHRIFRCPIYGQRQGLHQDNQGHRRYPRRHERSRNARIPQDIANVQLGPEIRRGIADLDGKGEVAGGIVVVRFGENVLNVIERVKQSSKTTSSLRSPRV